MNKKETLYLDYRSGKISKDQLLLSVAEIDRPTPSLFKQSGIFLLALIFPFFIQGSK